MFNKIKNFSNWHKNVQPLFFVFFILSISLLLHLFCMTKTHLFVEEAYYWNYSQHLDFSYLDHPPMVALLIKLSTTLLGLNEFAVRSANLLCWFVMALFSYKLTELIHRGSGIYSVLLLAILPFFFLQTIIITPDVPLLACWSASLYCLYRALVLQERHYWYWTGLWMGLGMLSKYTIALLGVTTLFYMVTVPAARSIFKRKEPYFCTLIVIVLFTPVIYWNATHAWVSFIFQSTRRFSETASTHIFYLLGLTLFFLTPLGLFSLATLNKKKSVVREWINFETQRFIQMFTLAPLGFFVLFSLNHEIKFNWIGPIFLALTPWIAVLMTHIQKQRKGWFNTAFIILICFSTVLLTICYNPYEKLQQKVFLKLIAWDSLIKELHGVAQEIEMQTHKTPAFVPLDHYPISSELAFYQKKLMEQGGISKPYPVISAHIFGINTLMYKYWAKEEHLTDVPLIIISKELWRFGDQRVTQKIVDVQDLAKVWSTSESQSVKNIPFYYKVVQLKPTTN